MKPIIYADTLFLFNFFMDTIILIITDRLLFAKASVFKIGLSGAMGAVYSVAMFFPELGFLYGIILKAVVLFGLCYLTFGGKTVKSALKNFAVFLLVNVCVGGLTLALVFLTDFGTVMGAVIGSGEIYINLSPVILIIAIAGTYIFLGIYQKMSKRRLYEKSLIKRAQITYKGKTAEIDLFLDTGLRSSDPINDKAVIIAEYRAVKMLLSENERSIIEENKGTLRAYEGGMRVLPFSTINGDNTIYAVVADRVTGEDFSKEKVTVGMVTDKKFGSEYKGLLNPEILLKESAV